MLGPELKATYRSQLKDAVQIRRYAADGVTVAVEAYARARVAYYTAAELIGTIQQGDRKVIIYADDVETDFQTFLDTGMTLPITPDDKCVIGSDEYRIMAAVPRTALDGALAAYALQVRGP